MNNATYQLEYLTYTETAKILNISKKTISRLIKKCSLNKIVINEKCIRIPKESIDAYITQQKQQNNNLTLLNKNSILDQQSDCRTVKMENITIKPSWRIRDGYIYIRQTVHKKPYVIYAGRDEKEAIRKLYEFKLKKFSNQLDSPQIMVFDNQNNNILFNDYAKKVVENYSGKSKQYMQDKYRIINPYFENILLKDMTYSRIKEFTAIRSKMNSPYFNKDGTLKKLSPNTIKNDLNFLGTILSEALKEELIDKHPIRGMKLKPSEILSDIHPITGQIKQNYFINCFEGTEQLIIQFAILTGLRKDTILKLKKSEFDLFNSQLILPSQRTKNKKTQYFPLSKPAVNILTSIQNDSEYFFLNPLTGLPYSTAFRKNFKNAVKKTGLHPSTTFHDLRRTFAFNLKARDASIYDISKALGHCDIKVTARYLRETNNESIRKMLSDYGNEFEQQRINNNIIPLKVATKIAAK